jgi:hypothetical protein
MIAIVVHRNCATQLRKAGQMQKEQIKKEWNVPRAILLLFLPSYAADYQL